MKGTTVYYENGKAAFSVWQAKLKDMMGTDSKANPMLWWSECLICRDYVVCGLPTKKETLDLTRDHMREDH